MVGATVTAALPEKCIRQNALTAVRKPKSPSGLHLTDPCIARTAISPKKDAETDTEPARTPANLAGVFIDRFCQNRIISRTDDSCRRMRRSCTKQPTWHSAADGRSIPLTSLLLRKLGPDAAAFLANAGCAGGYIAVP